jgi:predicted dehydrogenase
MRMSRVRIALVGTGTMGSLHARVLHAADTTELVSVVEPRPDVGRAVADRYGARWAADLDGMGDVDAVVVAAATEAHHDVALEVIGAGLPLLLEKPVSDDLAKAEEVVRASEQADVALMCGLPERFNSAVVTAFAAVREPVHVQSVRSGPYAPRIRTGVAWDLLLHDVDLAVRLLGEPREVGGRLGHFHPASSPSAEDVAEAQLVFPDGALFVGGASRIGQRKIRTLTIQELDRAVEVDLLRQDVTIYRHVHSDSPGEDGLGYRQQTIIEIPAITQLGEPLVAQLDHFLRVLDGSVDAADERRTILPAHRVIGALSAAGPAS